MTAEQVYHYLKDQRANSERLPGFNIIAAGGERGDTRFDRYKKYIGSFYECDVDVAELDLIESPIDKVVVVGRGESKKSRSATTVDARLSRIFSDFDTHPNRKVMLPPIRSRPKRALQGKSLKVQHTVPRFSDCSDEIQQFCLGKAHDDPQQSAHGADEDDEDELEDFADPEEFTDPEESAKYAESIDFDISETFAPVHPDDDFNISGAFEVMTPNNDYVDNIAENGSPDETGIVENGSPDETGIAENGSPDETGIAENGSPDETGIAEDESDITRFFQ